MSLEPPTTVEPSRDDLSAARYWLDLAASNLPPDVFDGRKPDHLKIAAVIGQGYAAIANIDRWTGWRAEDLARIRQDRKEDLARLARNREQDYAQREAEIEGLREREARAIRALQETVTAIQNMPGDWRAVYVAQWTPGMADFDEEVPPGWYVYGGKLDPDDPEAGVPYALRVEEAGPNLDVEMAARLIAARLNRAAA